jgi:hypothetical protein
VSVLSDRNKIVRLRTFGDDVFGEVVDHRERDLGCEFRSFSVVVAAFGAFVGQTPRQTYGSRSCCCE